jgi:hypothetical protein
VKDDIDAVYRQLDDVSITDITVHKFCSVLDRSVQPRRLAIRVSLRFEIIEHADKPTLGLQQIDDVGTDQSSASGNERPLFSRGKWHDLFVNPWSSLSMCVWRRSM